MPDPKCPLAENLLAIFAGRERAAAILGDLTEMSQTRSRLWFWIAYVRTLISLGWRTPVAFLVGYSAFELSVWLVVVWIRHAPPTWVRAERSPLLLNSDEFIFFVCASLWFALPYGIARYGFRDKFVRIACVVLPVATFVFLCPPLLSTILATALALACGGLILSPPWRKPTIVLGSTIVASAAVQFFLFNAVPLATIYLREQLRLPLNAFEIPWKTIDLVALFVPAIVCSLLHDRLLRSPAIGTVHA